ncbi:nudC domain-containing protein 1 [Grammomys surdaster]|uniref:nudC domain-containing protein 1 n=1 Tax=Grammomys surdaster TaxID=491861 RepID=UPI00109F64B7|nr:nudC domain-containing protein 1 [Grammomys surdaster]
MEAANSSLQVKRPLLDPRFEGYKLSLEPLPCYQLELDAAVAEVKLRDDQYTLEHMNAFGMYNYLHCDAWYQDSVYYIDNLGRIMNLTVMLDTALGKPREVFRLPTDVTAYDNRLCASIHFTSPSWVTLADGTGRLYVIGTGDRGNSPEKWEIVFNEELGNPFIIIHSVSFLKGEEHSVGLLLLRIEKEEVDMKGSGFYVSLEWVIVSKKKKDSKKYKITKHHVLRGKSVPHYAAIEPNGSGLMIVSYKAFKVMSGGQDLEESMDEDRKEEIKGEPLYYWQQSEDDLTVAVKLPESSTKEDIQIQFLPNDINIKLKGIQVLEGKLYSSIDHKSSTWTIKENNSLEISLFKKNEGLMWPELIVGDKQGKLARDPAECAAIAERLMHLTSDELDPDKEQPPCTAQDFEECDIFLEESASLCRFDGNTLRTTHVVNLGSNQYLFTALVDPKKMPCFCLRHDVDALLWQPHCSKQDDMWDHIATFNALGYVQASKRDKKFFSCAPNYSYAALCECLRRVFIYRQPTPMSTVLYNRKEGRHVGQVAKQQVASLETNDPILGFQATNERLFVLTTKNLFLIKINTEN